MNGLRARVQIQVPRSFDRRTGELNGLLCVLLVLLQDFISGRLRWCLWILDVPTLNATEIRFERAFGHPALTQSVSSSSGVMARNTATEWFVTTFCMVPFLFYCKTASGGERQGGRQA